MWLPIMVLSPATQHKVMAHLRYKGQTWFCRRCEVNHVGPCPFLQVFYAAKYERSKHQIDLKVVSDSSLRLAEQVGLRADVQCMSGGGLGHLATVLQDDPMMAERKDIAIVTGGNDIRQLDTFPPEDIVFAIDRSVAKVVDELNRHPDKQFTIINLKDDPRKPALRPDQALVAEYLVRGLDKLHGEQVTVVHMPQKLEEVDKTGHPTERATKEIIQLLSAEHGDNIILNEEFVTTDRMYAGVQSIYKYGCRTCPALGQFPRPLEACPTCLQAKATYGGGEKWEVFLNSLPPPPSISNEIYFEASSPEEVDNHGKQPLSSDGSGSEEELHMSKKTNNTLNNLTTTTLETSMNNDEWN